MSEQRDTTLIQERERVTRVVAAVSAGVVASDGDLLHDPYLVHGVLTAFKALNLVGQPHSLTEEQAWEWCRNAGPHPERIWAGLGLLGNHCGDCHGCSCYDDCPSRDDLNNLPEECGQ